MDSKIMIVYGKDDCTWCTAAKKLLDSKGITYEYIDGSETADMLVAYDLSTVPQVFLGNGRHIGGFMELTNHLRTEESK